MAPDVAQQDVRAFLAASLLEARRYGDDDTVWVRELTQNARDAVATTITFTLDGEDVIVDDDGAGMSRATVIDKLLRLFSSTKGKAEQAGCFGVGFWSVLLPRPSAVRVDTCDGDSSTSLVIDVDGATVVDVEPRRRERGTSVRLVGIAIDVVRLRAAILHHASRVRGAGDGPPPRVVLNAPSTAPEVLNRPFDLSDLDGVIASTPLVGRGFSGVIGLTTQPTVELFQHGLRVMQATSLAALVPSLAGTQPRGSGVALRVDVPGLTVLVDRRTVVEDATIQRLVKESAAKAIALERHILDDTAPLPWWRRVVRGAARAIMPTLERVGGWPVVFVIALTLFAGVLGGTVLHDTFASTTPQPTTTARGLSDVVNGLGAPQIDVRGRDRSVFLIVTKNITDDLVIEVRSIPDDDAGLRPAPLDLVGVATKDPPPFVASAQLSASGTTPLPHSQVLWPAQVTVAGAAIPILLNSDGVPFVEVKSGSVVDIFYVVADRAPARWPQAVPNAALADIANTAKGLAPEDAVAAIAEATANAISYAADDDAAQRWRSSDAPFIERALSLGIGDCDVINTVLVRALQQAGLHARLARGLIVRDDVVANELHAWAEVEIDGAWLKVDASPLFAIPQPPTPTPTTNATTAPPSVRAPTTTQPSTQPSGPPAPPETLVVRPARALVTVPPAQGRSNAVVAALSAVAALLVVGTAIAWSRRRRGGRSDDDVDDDSGLAVFLMALRRGGTLSLDLLDRRVLPTSHGRISLNEAQKRIARGELARGQSPMLAASVRSLDVDNARVRALLPHLPQVPDAHLITTLDVPSALHRVQQRIDESFTAVAVHEGAGAGIQELLLHTRDGRTHHIVIGPDVRAAGVEAVWTTLVREATSLRWLRRKQA